MKASSRAQGRLQSLGILGFGDFGQFAALHLRDHFSLRAWDRRDLHSRAQALAVEWSSLEGCASCDILVPAVPVQDLEEVLRRVAPHLREGTLVVDVASVKERPVELMQKLLPRHVEIAATHPMFGPQSGRDGIAGLKVVLCPVRGGHGVREFLEQKLGLQVIPMTPEEHDRQIAYIQGLTHWVARAIREIHMPDLDLATPAYRHLLSIEEILRQDSDALFLTIQRENAFTGAARAELRQRLQELEDWIEQDSTTEQRTEEIDASR